MWYYLEVFNTALNNILRYYWTNWANRDVLQVAPIQMADIRAENGGYIITIKIEVASKVEQKDFPILYIYVFA